MLLPFLGARIMHKYDLVLAPGAGRLLRHFYLYALALSNRDASSGPLRSWTPLLRRLFCCL